MIPDKKEMILLVSKVEALLVGVVFDVENTLKTQSQGVTLDHISQNVKFCVRALNELYNKLTHLTEDSQ